MAKNEKQLSEITLNVKESTQELSRTVNETQFISYQTNIEETIKTYKTEVATEVTNKEAEIRVIFSFIKEKY